MIETFDLPAEWKGLDPLQIHQKVMTIMRQTGIEYENNSNSSKPSNWLISLQHKVLLQFGKLQYKYHIQSKALREENVRISEDLNEQIAGYTNDIDTNQKQVFKEMMKTHDNKEYVQMLQKRIEES